MFNWFKTKQKELMFVGKLYKPTRDLGLNCGKPYTFNVVKKDSILLLISKMALNDDMMEYTFFFGNKKIKHTNKLTNEQWFFDLFIEVDENT